MDNNFTPILVVAVITIIVAIIMVSRKEADQDLQIKQRDEEELKKLQEEEQKRLQEEYRTNLQNIYNLIINIVNTALSIWITLPKEIEHAEIELDKAEKEFSEGAFAPFWDAIERSANQLARFDRSVLLINEKFKNYYNEIKFLESKPPSFPLKGEALPDINITIDRLNSLVRNAQKDFHFATIYEQRKTNQLLVEGFTNLGQALSDMSYRLETSISELASSITYSIDDLAESNRADTKELISELGTLKEHLVYESSARRSHEKKERDMLDNIQRKRKPFF